ncbi:MAG: type-F conjugative transfer system secretin TraK [Hydrogenophilales bacterium]|nr:type-F conjugative transfer system secretin TraK [Hydrogenophilales bacterium]
MAASKTLLFLAGLLLTTPAWALQKLEVKPDATATARIALKETSRIKVEGAAIVDVFGSVYAPDNPAGELMVAPDAASGEIYVMPSAQALPGKPINIFVKTDKATYTLLLTPIDVPSETVILNDRIALAKLPESAEAIAPAPDWLRQIKNMMLVLTSDAPAPGYLATTVGKPVGLWQEARFFEVRRVANRRLAGAIFDLTNISAAPMVLDEREFFDTGVVAVGVVKTQLAPNESTQVYIVREKRGE